MAILALGQQLDSKQVKIVIEKFERSKDEEIAAIIEKITVAV